MTNRFSDALASRPVRFLFAAAAVAAAIAPVSAFAQSDDGHKPVCLQVSRIDHTEILNDHQILFYLRGQRDGHKVWVNNLTDRCSTLTRDEGFVWESSIPEYCDNLEIIRVLRTGQVCTLGAFSPYEKAS